MLNPVDPTTTPAWKRLTELHDSMTPDLRAWFADDPERAERFSYELGDLYVDLSKNLLTDDVRDALAELAVQVDVPGRRDAMYAGEHINITEDRAVLHTALRRPATDSLTVDGQDVVGQQVLGQIDVEVPQLVGEALGALRVVGKPGAQVRGHGVVELGEALPGGRGGGVNRIQHGYSLWVSQPRATLWCQPFSHSRSPVDF